MIDDLICPTCKKPRLNKMGFLWSGHNKRQRYVCRECHSTTIKPEIKKEAEATPVKVITPAVEVRNNETPIT